MKEKARYHHIDFLRFVFALIIVGIILLLKKKPTPAAETAEKTAEETSDKTEDTEETE